MTTFRCYHPETGEPFDVPKHRFDDLVLNQGWLQTPPPRSSKQKAGKAGKAEANRAFKPKPKPKQKAREPEEDNRVPDQLLDPVEFMRPENRRDQEE